MPRPKSKSQVYHLVLTLHPGRDDDLIAFMERYPPGSSARPGALKAALRGGLPQDNQKKKVGRTSYMKAMVGLSKRR